MWSHIFLLYCCDFDTQESDSDISNGLVQRESEETENESEVSDIGGVFDESEWRGWDKHVVATCSKTKHT